MSLNILGKIFFVSLILSLSSCASKVVKSTENADSQADWKPDPLKPPRVEIRGLTPGVVYSENSKIGGKISVENFPLKSGFKGVIFLNGEALADIENPTQDFEIEQGLREGANSLSVVLIGPQRQTLKNPEAVQAIEFYYKKKIDALSEGAGVLTLVSPRGIYKGDAALEIPIDFVSTSKASVLRVYYSLNGEIRELSGSGPFYFRNLPPALYKLKIWEVDKNGKKVGGLLSEISTEFKVE
jgi:hypothetical protein